ncbi:hypothetical protein M422DRAFT_178191 [Sphaerobolus stellatus SS14]|uniref:USP domain-containing protein n=1 Tax=Sphaerobolus stellatus (strain SS14) TaxID=990650 RepID=A0A0C9U388_SPHS4|nr:hypothetical protein M422DRAFT_178191 [Sphaerobolus stellatus SS14]
MNSVLQGLMATKTLEELVMTRHSNQQAQHSPLLAAGNDSEEDQQEPKDDGMPVGDIFIATLEKAWITRNAGDRKDQSPRALLTAVGKKYGQYLDFRQQDAHEFLGHLLDSLRMEELDVIKKRRAPQPPLKEGELASLSPPVSKPASIIQPEDDEYTPFVDMLYNGKLMSVLVCETCKNVSHTFENFDDLSLPIPHELNSSRKVRTTITRPFVCSSALTNTLYSETASKPP